MMERHYDGEQEHRRSAYDRDAGRRFPDHDEQDFTQRSFARPRDRHRDDELDEGRVRFDEDEYEYGGRRPEWRHDRREAEHFPEDTSWRSSRERQERFRMSRFDPEPRGSSRRFAGERWGDHREPEERSSGRYEDSFEDAPGRRGFYGGHHSREGWREQRGWGRDIARDLGDDYDPYAGRFAGRGPKSYQRGDERVREDVCDRLTADARVDASNITVSVQGGEVTLEGTVDDRGMKRRAEDVADAVGGVRQVHNRLTVQTQNRSDEEMQPFQWGGERGWRGWEPTAGRGGFATRERDVPYGVGGVQRAGVHGSYGAGGGYPGAGHTSNVGWGQYERRDYGDASRRGPQYGGRYAGRMHAERTRDEQQGAWLGEEPGRFGNRGPKGYQRSDDRIREDVCDRLTDDDAVDATNLTVIVKDGEVTLEGTVDHRGMKRRAEDCADDVPGVRQVHNRLVVQPQHQGMHEPATSIGTSGGAAATGGTASTRSGRS